MKTLFIPVHIDFQINEKRISSLKLPKNLVIAYSIQYQGVAEKIKKILFKSHKIHSFIQVLGCSKPKISNLAEAILLVSSGKFHATSLASETGLPVYVLESDHLIKISNEEITSFNQRKKAAYMNFLNSEKIGILISTKPGQEKLKRAISLRHSLKNKNSYLFITNEINIKEFENFGIKSWVNTACPRMDFDSSIININSIKL